MSFQDLVRIRFAEWEKKRGITPRTWKCHDDLFAGGKAKKVTVKPEVKEPSISRSEQWKRFWDSASEEERQKWRDARKSKLSEEERKERRRVSKAKAKATYMAKRKALGIKRTPEERQAANERHKQWVANLSPERLAAYKAKVAASQLRYQKKQRAKQKEETNVQ